MACKCICKNNSWTEKKMGNQTGKIAIVTGANSGIGYYTALELGKAGAKVIIACRDSKRGKEALEQLQKEAPHALFQLELLDLSDLMSVRLFAEKFIDEQKHLDVLVNNAGIMALPKREFTADGFEKQFGTNHLGHFALTGLLLPSLKKSKAPRVVTVSSSMAAYGNIEMDNLQSERVYEPMKTYSLSKLANLSFMLELGQRYPWLTSVAAHPGATVSNLQEHKFKLLTKVIGQHASQGALPTLRAAVEDTKSGTYYGPRCWFQMRGKPIEVKLPKSVNNGVANKEVWGTSEQLTGVKYLVN